MTKIALGIEYAGNQYSGWQRQKQVSSVQQALETAISKVANEHCDVFCAGRTDAGVHATGQVIHFETNAIRSKQAWNLGVNALLPKDIAVRWSKAVDDGFHARFSALARRYRYIIYINPSRPAIFATGLTHYYSALNEQLMHQAGQVLIGEHDFTSFRASQCQSHSPWRNIHHLNIYRKNYYIVIDIQANAFVHHMVRNIVGCLIEVGAGKKEVAWLSWLLTQKDRSLAAPTAKAEGLYLIDVIYPTEFNLPKSHLGPLFLE